MKRSELTLTGETYRLTPDSYTGWGNESVLMIDEDLVEKTAQAASDDELPGLDDDPNDKPETVEMATDETGKYYAILPQYTSLSGGRKKWTHDMYRQCQNPADVDTDGTIEMYGSWESFDDEDDDSIEENNE